MYSPVMMRFLVRLGSFAVVTASVYSPNVYFRSKSGGQLLFSSLLTIHNHCLLHAAIASDIGAAIPTNRTSSRPIAAGHLFGASSIDPQNTQNTNRNSTVATETAPTANAGISVDVHATEVVQPGQVSEAAAGEESNVDSNITTRASDVIPPLQDEVVAETSLLNDEVAAVQGAEEELSPTPTQHTLPPPTTTPPPHLLPPRDYTSIEKNYHVLSPADYDEYYAIHEVVQRFKGRLVYCQSPQYPQCDIFLCGTLHVAQASAAMVREAIQVIAPQFVIVEVCETRIANLIEAAADEEVANITLADVFRHSFQQRSVKQFGMGMLSWMQARAAKGTNSQLGGELAAAAKEGSKLGATIVLGDRLYAVTIQRVFDRLRLLEKVKMVGILLWEVVTMSLGKLKEYIHKSENDEDFVRQEIEKFGRYLPSVAEVIIHERDEYLAATILETARIGFRSPSFSGSRRGRIVAVVGAGHLLGIERWLAAAGGVSSERLAVISASSKHTTPTWPGAGILSVVNSTALYPQPPLGGGGSESQATGSTSISTTSR